MINFISTSKATSDSFGRLLTVQDLIERRKNSYQGELKLWGFLVASNGKTYKTSSYPLEIFLYSDGDIRRFVYGLGSRLKSNSRFDRYIAFTKREKIDEFYKKSIHRDKVVNLTPDVSIYFTEVYD